MKQNSRFKLSALAIATAMACSPAAFATNGYFLHGFGTKASGMGGVGVALPQDAIAAATNPAGISWAGSRVDVGVSLFSPLRDGQVDATGIGGDPSSNNSGATLFLVPNAGFAMDMAGMTMGFTMIGNGGMNTRYNSNTYFNSFADAVGGFVGNLMTAYALDPLVGTIPTNAGLMAGDPTASSTLGVNLAQLIMAPSVSTKLGENNSVGASLLVGYQRFRAYGFGLFKGLSSDPTKVTNNGDDDAWGAGLRFGWTGNLTDTLTVGATYSSKIYMQKFEKYAGLFAEQGDFDIPSNYGLGIAFKPSSELTFALDVQKILYGDVAAIANAGPTADEFFNDLSAALTSGTSSPIPFTDGKQMGLNGGYGYGWEDMTVYKLGMSYALNDQWTLRGGFNYGESPVPNSQNLLNVTAPGIVEKHLTLGFTYQPAKNTEVSVSAMHAFRKDQSYTYNGTDVAGPADYTGYAYDANIGMSQNQIEVSYGLKF